jgi:ribonuclease D
VRLRKPIELAVLKSVATWRELEARAKNVPRGRVLKDDALSEIAVQQPQDLAALARLRTIPKGWERSGTAAGVLEAVNAALALPREEMPRLPKQPQLPEGTAAAVELLKVLLKHVAEKEGVAAKMLASGDDIERIAANGAEADVPALHGWRREVFGDTALKLVRGELALRFEDRKVAIFEP